MRYTVLGIMMGFGLVACHVTPEREPLRPLVEDGVRLSYGELLSRLHRQASVAMDAFFVDAWNELDEAARSMDQTARFLGKTLDAPEHLKADLAQKCANLQLEAGQLGEAARAKNVDSATRALQRVTMQVRQLKASQR